MYNYKPVGQVWIADNTGNLCCRVVLPLVFSRLHLIDHFDLHRAAVYIYIYTYSFEWLVCSFIDWLQGRRESADEWCFCCCCVVKT